MAAAVPSGSAIGSLPCPEPNRPSHSLAALLLRSSAAAAAPFLEGLAASIA